MEPQTVLSSADSIATDLRWKAHSSILRDLYIDQNLSLKKVKEIMEEKYGFPDFPESIYETRLRDTLKLTKYLKGHDWQAIHNELLAREQCGKQSRVFHNGRILSQQKIVKGTRRYRSVATKGTRQVNRAHLPPNVTIRSPSPTPSRAMLSPRASHIRSSTCRSASSPQLALNPSSPLRNYASSLEATPSLPFQAANNVSWPTLDHEAPQSNEHSHTTANTKQKMPLLYRHYAQLIRGMRNGRPQKSAGKVHKRKGRESAVDTESQMARPEYLPQEDNRYTSQSMLEPPIASARPEGSVLMDVQSIPRREGSSVVTSRGSPPFPSMVIEDRQVLLQDTEPAGWVDLIDSSRPAMPSASQSNAYEVTQSDADASAAAAIEYDSPRSQSFDEQAFVSGASDPPAEDSWMFSKSPVASSSSASRATSGKSRAPQSSSRSRSSLRGALPPSASGSSHTAGSRSTRSRQSIMALPVVSFRHLIAPDSLLFPEKSMFFARQYISKTFSSGLWTSSQSTDTLDTECIKLERWFNDFNPGLEFLYTKRINESFRVLQRCFGATKEVLLAQDPRFVIYICQQAIRFVVYDNLGRNLARTLLKYTAELCRNVFTAHHPLYIIMDQMARMDHFEFTQSIQYFMECYFDYLEPFLNQTSEAFGFVTNLRGLTISLLEQCKIITRDEATPIVDRLVQKAQRLNHSTLQLKIEMASIYQRSRYFQEARAICEEIIDSEEAKKRPYERSYVHIVLIVTLRSMGVKLDDIIRVNYSLVDFLSQPMEFASDFSRELFESQAHSTFVLALGKLEKDLRDSGRTEEADKILARLETVMNETYGVEDLTDDPHVGAL